MDAGGPFTRVAKLIFQLWGFKKKNTLFFIFRRVRTLHFSKKKNICLFPFFHTYFVIFLGFKRYNQKYFKNIRKYVNLKLTEQYY